MKGRRMRILPGIAVLGLVLAVGSPAWAEESSGISHQVETPAVLTQVATKFARGVANLTTGWVEFPKQIYLVGHKEGWVSGAIRGPIEGLGMFIARTVVGAYDILTFPLPIPPQYRPMLTPEYVWQPEPAEESAHAEGLSPLLPPK